MNRAQLPRYVLLGLCVSLTGILCSNPTDQQPFRWRWFGEVPFTNEKFVLAEELPNLNDNITTDTLADDTTKMILLVRDGQPVAFGARKKDETDFVIEPDPPERETFSSTLGAVTIAKTGTQAAPVGVGQTVSIPLPSIFHVGFDATSPDLSLTVTNTSSSDLSDVTVTIAGIGTVDVGTVAASGGVSTGQLATAGTAIDSTLEISVTANGGGAGDAVTVSLSFDGLVADTLVIIDTLVQFTKRFDNNHEMTDTVEMYYVDVNEANYIYSLDNRTGMSVKVRGIHNHVWTRQECVNRGVESVSDIATKFNQPGDTVNFFRGRLSLADQPVEVFADSLMNFGGLDLSAKRLFPEWQDTVTITHVSYEVTPSATGKRISISKNDSLTFIIDPIVFKLDKFKGKIREPYTQDSDTEFISIPYPWDSSAIASLRNGFRLDSVMAQVDVTVGIGDDQAYLDSMDVFVQLFAAAAVPAVACSLRTTLSNVHNGATYRRSINITPLINVFPDSVGVLATATTPAGAEVLVVNDRDTASVTRMTLAINSAYRLDAYIDYHTDTIVPFDMGYGDFDMVGATRLLSKMEERRVSAILDISNHTNVNVSLFGLMGPGEKRFALDSLSTDSVSKLVEVAGIPDGFINITGPSGVMIPSRNQTHRDTILLDDHQLEAMLECDDCETAGWRWLLKFAAQPLRDHLNDTDYIEINSKFRIEGIQNTDSLLIWE